LTEIDFSKKKKNQQYLNKFYSSLPRCFNRSSHINSFFIIFFEVLTLITKTNLLNFEIYWIFGAIQFNLIKLLFGWEEFGNKNLVILTMALELETMFISQIYSWTISHSQKPNHRKEPRAHQLEGHQKLYICTWVGMQESMILMRLIKHFYVNWGAQYF
jgi:hypothetical protein